jgi:hypothetical protein
MLRAMVLDTSASKPASFQLPEMTALMARMML